MGSGISSPGEEEWRDEERLREGRDFTTAEELRARAGPEQARVVRCSAGEKLARAVEQETDWLTTCGTLPGGLAWDDQPAWRVRLWAHCLAVRERAQMPAVGIM